MDKKKISVDRIVRFVNKKSIRERINHVGLRECSKRLLRLYNRTITQKNLAIQNLYSQERLNKQRKHVFKRKILISIIVPLYNTNCDYLEETIKSVLNQTYNNWELCLADASDYKHEYIEDICKGYASKDKRIKYKKLEGNLGISENTNTCIKMSTGDYLALLDHDDILHPAALFETMNVIEEYSADFIYTDEAKFINDIRKAYDYHFKPAYAPDTLLSVNYICHLSVFSKELFELVGGFRKEYDGSQDHEFFLRATKAARKVMHIPEVLYYWRSTPESVANNQMAKPYASMAGIRAVTDFLKSEAIDANVSSINSCRTRYRIKYPLKTHPKVSILIPNYEHLSTLKTCIDSIIGKTTYDNYEIVIIENNSGSSEIFDYYAYLEKTHNNIKVLFYNGKFNYSKINNFGVKNTDGEIILLLNNDIEVITPDWIQEMLMFAIRNDVGAVGAKLYYPNMTIQHAGVVLGAGGIAGHSFYKFDADDYGYIGKLCYVQNVTAVTAACLMIRRNVWSAVSGLNEEIAVAFNDVDLCMKIRKLGYLIVWTPFSELLHNESLSRGKDTSKENKIRFKSEIALFKRLWGIELKKGDPYYNPNFKITNANYMFKNILKPHKAR